jgi:hypothetical protein
MTNLKQPIAKLEKLLAELGAQLEADAPPEHRRRLERVLAGLKRNQGQPLPPELQKELLAVRRFELEAQRLELLEQRERLRPAVQAGDAVAEQADAAVRKVLEVLELGLVGAGAAGAENEAALEAASARAREALYGLDAAYTGRAVGPLTRSAEGAEAPEGPGAAGPLQSFRVRPGTASGPRR